GEIKAIPSGDLKEGDFVVVPRERFANSQKSDSISLIKFLKEKEIKKDDVLITGATEDLGEKGYKKRQNKI
ncbi:MAG: hypothetical protein GWO20_13975, partial [Candidatus Korarchaeota archaeon]|nr:hypothetical protein [Candidatus Korarchaeota archaeon]NIU84525.1 hypothetical protein [Candidatus Thorarchaeota archaeon]NIW14592.1 hypothetical protein [Candidatus Thorarchaeota archaeon]NIW52664.1 hypothetical protein [Candidatus Korarchaeota archaeon]